MKELHQMAQFKRDMKTITPPMKLKVAEVVQGLRYGFDPQPAMRPHGLKWRYSGWNECHVMPDMLLVYRVDSKTVALYRVCSHAKLFG